jgi:hypothetical protein
MIGTVAANCKSYGRMRDEGNKKCMYSTGEKMGCGCLYLLRVEYITVLRVDSGVGSRLLLLRTE